MRITPFLAVGLLVVASTASAQSHAGEHANLRHARVRQQGIQQGRVSNKRLRRIGLRIFTTPFNRLDGYGDGPLNPSNTWSPGGRPTLQGNGMLLRVNGLDAQSCLECHSLISAATVPMTLGIGGAGGSVTNAMVAPFSLDPADLTDRDGNAGFDGRFINPPALFGSAGVELFGLEMTADLQRAKAQALANPGR